MRSVGLAAKARSTISRIDGVNRPGPGRRVRGAMGTLGGEEAFFLGVLGVAGAGGDFAGEDSEELRVIVALPLQ